MSLGPVRMHRWLRSADSPAVGGTARAVLRGWPLLVALALGLGVLGGCDKPSTPQGFKATDITGVEYGRSLALTDHTGAPRTLADYRGKVVVLFFGFTQCPDVCPTTLATMAQVMQQLGADADRVQVLFVTLDPKRDTQAVLAKYVTAFDPRFVALLGDAEATARAAKEFRVFFQRSEGTSPDNYSIDHTAASYVLDAGGRLRLHVRHGQSPQDVTADLRRLLSAS